MSTQNQRFSLAWLRRGSAVFTITQSLLSRERVKARGEFFQSLFWGAFKYCLIGSICHIYLVPGMGRYGCGGFLSFIFIAIRQYGKIWICDICGVQIGGEYWKLHSE